MLRDWTLPIPAAEIGGAAPALPRVRHKLWQIDGRYHCSIIGTCLTLDDMRAVARKASLAIAPAAPSYEVHGAFVKLAGERSPAAKLIHKTLDRNFATEIARLGRRSDDAALRAAWQRANETGNVLGTYWAILSHPDASAAFCHHIHGEVHMLSHLQGEATQVAIGRLRQAQADCLTLEVKLDQQRRHTEATIRARDEIIAGLQARLAAVPAQTPAMAATEAAPAPSARRVEARLAALDQRLRAERARAAQPSARMRAWPGACRR